MKKFVNFDKLSISVWSTKKMFIFIEKLHIKNHLIFCLNFTQGLKWNKCSLWIRSTFNHRHKIKFIDNFNFYIFNEYCCWICFGCISFCQSISAYCISKCLFLINILNRTNNFQQIINFSQEKFEHSKFSIIISFGSVINNEFQF